MTSPELDRLVKAGLLKLEPPEESETKGLIALGDAKLTDAQNPSLSLESRFDLAYNAAHAFSLAALRRMGYRPSNRYIEFQTLPHTLGISAKQWRTLAKSHEVRNETEYGGTFEADEQLVADVISVTKAVREAL
jgi:hypothetical protein